MRVVDGYSIEVEYLPPFDRGMFDSGKTFVVRRKGEERVVARFRVFDHPGNTTSYDAYAHLKAVQWIQDHQAGGVRRERALREAQG